ncbi:hypothetical protein AAFF_G00357670 [Aldrovandia affinis]|uniref:Uncharacterized protein n=1 Tax=Aldrovandia affinis TaxID=143900 RepID=A0AAD7T8N4_9TELE|nr:hypothetical protein AAFF_G00357670 [Aldrovandia affinis]
MAVHLEYTKGHNEVIDNMVTASLLTDDTAVVVLFLFLTLIILALVYTYKRLNRETDGEYTLTRLINGQGGARERVQNAVSVVESRLGIQLRQRKRGDIEGGEGDEEEEDREQERVSEKNAESLAEDAQDEDSSDDYSSLEGCDLREKKRLQGGSEKSKEGNRVSVGKKDEEKVEMTREKKEEKVMEGEENCQGGGVGGGLLADLKEFSGSAIWAEEKSAGEKDGCDLTEL